MSSKREGSEASKSIHFIIASLDEPVRNLVRFGYGASTQRKRGAIRPLWPAGRNGGIPRAYPHHGQALQRRSARRGGLAGDPGDALSALHPRHAGIHSPRTENAGRKMLREAQLVAWRVVFTRQAQKDAKKLSASGKRSKAEALLRILAEDPFRIPPPYEILAGDLA